jgi:hypothetical protein
MGLTSYYRSPRRGRAAVAPNWVTTLAATRLAKVQIVSTSAARPRLVPWATGDGGGILVEGGF